ncbi:hypothetical protein Aduo_000036 [Ancylostoma duodenale]
MPLVCEDDGVIVIDESFSSSFTRRCRPLREIEILDQPGPSSTSDNYQVKSKDDPLCDVYTRYGKLQEVEQLIARAKANSSTKRLPKVTPPENADLELQESIQNIDNNGFVEAPMKKRRKRKDLSETQLLKQQEKKRKAIEREKNAARNTKCEQYMYCHVSRRIFDSFPDAELNLRMVFMERNIQDQLICDEDRPDMRVLWYRKCIEAAEVDGQIEKREYEIRQHVFAVVLSVDSFKELIKSNSLEDFVASQKLSYSVPNSTLILIIFGNESRKLLDLSISLFDCYRTQLSYVHTAQEFAIYLAQISRALAKMERRLVSQDRLIVDVEKGVKDAAANDLIRDWWNKMLSVVARMHDAHRRAIVSAYPNPVYASKRFSEIGYTRAVEEIAEIQSESGRRLGPVMAHRLFMILTDTYGGEIVA